MTVGIMPLTYEVDAMRALMVEGGRSLYGIGLDFIVLVASNRGINRFGVPIASESCPLKGANDERTHIGSADHGRCGH